jgi:cytochrome c553
MARVFKWLGIAVGVAAVLGVAVFYIASNAIIYRHYPIAPSNLHVVSTPQTIAAGKHLAQIDGCSGCHGVDLAGQDFSDEYPGITLWTRNLSIAAKHFSNADFDRAVRQGLRADGTSLMLMPSEAYAAMSDDELADIVAYLRSVPAKGEEHPRTAFGLETRWAFLRGDLDTVRMTLAAEKHPLDVGPHFALGRHLAMMSCAECHGGALSGEQWPGPISPPDLTIAAAYDKPEFVKFMRTGKAAGNRELPLMSEIARMRGGNFTDAEVSALYDYLAARGKKLTGQ